MKIGYTTSGFSNHGLEETIEILDKLGYRGLEIVLDKQHYHPYFSSSISNVKKAIEDHRMEVVIGTGGRFALSEIKHEPTFINPDEKCRAKRIEFTKRAIDTCIELNGSVVTGHSGKLSDGVDAYEAFLWTIEGLGEVCDYANDRGVIFALEPEPGMLISSMKDWYTINKTINVGFCLDIGHVFCVEEDPVSAVKKGMRIANNIHLEDIKDRTHKHLKLGEGDINFSEILPLISRVNCMVNVELHDYSNEAETTAQDSIRKINCFLDKPSQPPHSISVSSISVGHHLDKASEVALAKFCPNSTATGYIAKINGA